jgi:hypothetical protein
MTDPRMQLLTLILEGNTEFQVDVTDESFVTSTLSGQNVSVLKSPTGIFLVISDIIRERFNGRISVLVFTEEQWEKLITTAPHDINQEPIEP